MANLKHIEFTTEAKYQGKVKSDDTLYAVPFIGGGGGGGTTLNKYTFNGRLTTNALRARFINIMKNAKIISTIIEDYSYCGLKYLGDSNAELSWFGSKINSNNNIFLFNMKMGSSGNANPTVSVLEIDGTSFAITRYSYSAPSATFTVTYYNDTEITE